VTADASASVDPLGAITTYQFDCGNGTVVGPQSAGAATCQYGNPGTYRVTVTVTDGQGRTDTATSAPVTATPESPPHAALSVTPSKDWTPTTVTVDASRSSDTDATPIATYRFDCGNGIVVPAQASPTAACRYTAAGSYTVTATVTDTAGLSGTATANVNVQADLVPSAKLSLSDKNIRTGDAVVLDASRSTDPDNTPISTYTFDCGNGRVLGPQTSPTATCSYPRSGQFTVAVTVTDTAGQSDTTSVGVHVK
jgi:PKD repeat protein